MKEIAKLETERCHTQSNGCIGAPTDVNHTSFALSSDDSKYLAAQPVGSVNELGLNSFAHNLTL